jgi:AraC-like DNA-binding protein
MGTDTATAGWASEIRVPYPEPPAYTRYKDRLPRFRFNCAAGVQIRFPARLLDERIPSADPVSVQLAIDRCEQEMARQAANLTTADLVRGKLVCQDGRYPDMAAMARMLLVSERTLKRRLQEEGSSFQALLDKARHQDSMRLLGNPALAVKQVAQAVGYTDPANFARAFSKWTGLSPREWRQRQNVRGLN